MAVHASLSESTRQKATARPRLSSPTQNPHPDIRPQRFELPETSRISDFEASKSPILDDSCHSVRVRCPCTLKAPEKKTEDRKRRKKRKTQRDKKESEGDPYEVDPSPPSGALTSLGMVYTRREMPLASAKTSFHSSIKCCLGEKAP